MSDDPDAILGQETDLEPVTEGGEAGGELAGDLDDAQLEAATEGAQDDLDVDREDDLDEAGEDDTMVVEPGALEAAPSMARGGADRLEPEIRGPRVRGPKTTRTAFAIDPALRIQDRASAVFVIVCVAVFALILANGLLLGHGGAFTPIPSASPIPIPTELPSTGPTTGPSTSPSAAPSPTGVPSTGPTGSSAPTVAPTAAPSPAAT